MFVGQILYTQTTWRDFEWRTNHKLSTQLSRIMKHQQTVAFQLQGLPDYLIYLNKSKHIYVVCTCSLYLDVDLSVSIWTKSTDSAKGPWNFYQNPKKFFSG